MRSYDVEKHESLLCYRFATFSYTELRPPNLDQVLLLSDVLRNIDADALPLSPRIVVEFEPLVPTSIIKMPRRVTPSSSPLQSKLN